MEDNTDHQPGRGTNLAAAEILGDGYHTFELDQSRLSEPLYLAFARWLASKLLHDTYTFVHDIHPYGWGRFREVIQTQKPLEPYGPLDRDAIDMALWFLDFNKRQDPKGKGLLWPDDMKQMMAALPEDKLMLPHPSPPSTERTHWKYGDWAITYNISMYNALLAGIPTGLISGVWDILHGGHVRALYEAANHLREKSVRQGTQGKYVLIVAVDLNRAVSDVKGPSRPLLSFEQRVNAVSQLPFVTLVTYHASPLGNQYPLGHPSAARSYRFLPFPFGDLRGGNWKPILTGGITPHDRKAMARLFKHMHLFYSEADPFADMKQSWANVLRITPVTLPQWVTMHTTDLEEHFGLVK